MQATTTRPRVQAKPLPSIFVAVRDLMLIVSGKTWQRCKALDRWPEAELSAEAMEAMDTFREAKAKREQYQQQRARV